MKGNLAIPCSVPENGRKKQQINKSIEQPYLSIKSTQKRDFMTKLSVYMCAMHVQLIWFLFLMVFFVVVVVVAHISTHWIWIGYCGFKFRKFEIMHTMDARNMLNANRRYNSIL